MGVMYYVTALALRGGDTQLPEQRTDMAKFFTREDAEAHMADFRSPSFFELRVEEREDVESDGRAHGRFTTTPRRL